MRHLPGTCVAATAIATSSAGAALLVELVPAAPTTPTTVVSGLDGPATGAPFGDAAGGPADSLSPFHFDRLR